MIMLWAGHLVEQALFSSELFMLFPLLRLLFYCCTSHSLRTLRGCLIPNAGMTGGPVISSSYSLCHLSYLH